MHRDYSDYMLRSLRGCLCFLCSYKESRLDLWEMEIYGVKSSWRKLILVPYVSDPEILGQFAAPLYISNGGKLILHIGCKLFVYDMKDGSSSEVSLECIQATTFVESLVSVNQKAPSPVL
ncbi:hypothetical protein HanPI659440_Chr05g0208931 [Helianthus annuus]|nr:hypothetical protein HanPI659440_Chr05g0208931 [Helianthus annuus]